MEVENLSNQMAHVLNKHFKADDTVALMMCNKPEFICWVLAAVKLKIKVALINTSTKLDTLAHNLKAADCVGIIFDEEVAQQVTEMHDAFPEMQLLCFLLAGNSDDKRVTSISAEDIQSHPTTSFTEWKNTYLTDTLGFIYTSGTTGLPKAGIISHLRLIGFGAYFTSPGGITSQDVVYDCLPIFHSAGLIPVMASIIAGCATCISRRFSPTRFWQEVVEYQCTVFQYIGEVGRFLVNHAQSHPEVWKINHKLRLAIGNGLQRDVWDQFQDGFRIPLVWEFYGSTEGNGALVNLCDREEHRGAVGRYGAIARMILGYKICKYDVDVEQMVRVNGRCVQCAPDEAGQLLLPIDNSRPETTFPGYTDPVASEKKIVRDVFVKGDQYFCTGDLLSVNRRGCYFFHDRIGDTFRWSGENVSTTEVSQVVSSFPGVVEANVYGVKVPNAPEGRACMVALIVDDEIAFRRDLAAFHHHSLNKLPKYAVPRFLRFLSPSKIEHTSTHKQVKTSLREAGCDPAQTQGDGLCYLTTQNVYEALTPDVYASWLRPSKL